MSVTVEKLENSMVKLVIEVDAAAFTKAIDKVYNKEKNRITVQGFRKGKAPRKVVERLYGATVFYEDAANDLINSTYEDAVKESGEEVVSHPSIGVEQIEEGKPFIYTAEVAVKPPVKLGEYLGVSIRKIDVSEPTDADVDAELERQRETNSRLEEVTDRPVADQDTVRLDYAGTVDGVAFDGGTAENQSLVIGSHSFIDNFEEQLIGMQIGEEKDVNVTFPENYQESSLAGKAAVFHCKINGIQVKVLPELNDEFADEVSEFSTLEELKEDIRKNLSEKEKESAAAIRQNEALAAAVNNAEIDIPEPMIRMQEENIVSEYEQRLRSQGIAFDQYLQYMGTTMEEYLKTLRPQAEQRIRNSLVLEAIADAENIVVTPEDEDKEFAHMAEQYSISIEQVRNLYSADEYKEDLHGEIRLHKAAELVTSNAVETQETESEPAEEEAPSQESMDEQSQEDAAQDNSGNQE